MIHSLKKILLLSKKRPRTHMSHINFLENDVLLQICQKKLQRVLAYCDFWAWRKIALAKFCTSQISLLQFALCEFWAIYFIMPNPSASPKTKLAAFKIF